MTAPTSSGMFLSDFASGRPADEADRQFLAALRSGFVECLDVLQNLTI